MLPLTQRGSHEPGGARSTERASPGFRAAGAMRRGGVPCDTGRRSATADRPGHGGTTRRRSSPERRGQTDPGEAARRDGHFKPHPGAGVSAHAPHSAFAPMTSTDPRERPPPWGHEPPGQAAA